MLSQKGISQLILLFLILIGIVLGVYLVQNYTRFVPKAFSPNEPSFSLDPTSATYNKGCEFRIDVNFNTAGADTDGVDAVLLFDPTILTVTNIENGSIYPAYPGNVINNNTGRVMISGISSISQPVNNAGKLATVTFKIKPETLASVADIQFDFDPNNTTKTNDTNIVESRTIVDILKSVSNAQINIGSNSGCLSEPSLSPTLSTSPTQKPNIVLNAKIDPLNQKKAIVVWTNVDGASLFDKIELFFERNSKMILMDWLYASTCRREVINNNIPKSSGSCSFSLPNNRGNFYFKYYKDSATTQAIFRSG